MKIKGFFKLITVFLEIIPPPQVEKIALLERGGGLFEDDV